MIELRQLSVRAGDFRLGEVSFRVPSGAYAVLMGRTGSGKSTLLEAICGLKPVTSGRVLLDDHDVTGRRPAERGIGYVPQDGALFAAMTAREQLAFALEIRREKPDVIAARVTELADLLGIVALLDRLPATFSGGERQRVALGRALAFRPSVLLLDEPLSAVDAETCAEMYELLKAVQAHTGVTTLHVTHNRQEARKLADVLLVLRDGAIAQSAPSACDTTVG